MTQPRVLGIVLAGGAGRRLMPLTADRAKPAVPFGGHMDLCAATPRFNLSAAGVTIVGKGQEVQR